MYEHIESICLAAFFFPSVAVVLVFLMKYIAAVRQARVQLGQEEAYRDLAATCAAAQAETPSAIADVAATLAEIRARLISIEAVLKQVE
jgi:hypothetical protein